MNELSEITGNENDEEIATPQGPSVPIDTPVQPIPNTSADQPILPTTTISTAELLKIRIEMYKLAEKIAKESGDNTRARSRARGVKTLEIMLKQALAGKPINLEEIPPVVSTKAPNAPSALAATVPIPSETPDSIPQGIHVQSEPQSEPEPEPKPVSQVISVGSTTSAVDEAKVNALLERQREYKIAALTAKKSGDTTTALQYVKIMKLFDTVLASARNGEAVDLSDMPPHPNELSSDMLKAVAQVPDPGPPSKQENTIQQSSEESTKPEQPAEAAPKPNPVDLPPPEVPKTILEALTQRLQKFQAAEANAKSEGNDRKARQNGRIVKQYQDAIKAHKAGRQFAFDELPTPPGYAPIPVTEQPKAAPAPRQPPVAPPKPSQSDDHEPESTSPKKSPIKRQDSRISGNHSNTSVMNKTIEILLERQKEFKEAALEAKKFGEIEQAKEFLKTFKGIENLLNVARGGLPVDLSTVNILILLLNITFSIVISKPFSDTYFTKTKARTRYYI